MKKRKGILSVFLALLLAVSVSVPAFAADKTELQKAIEISGAYLQKTVANPQISSIGGEWTVIGLARSAIDVPQDYFTQYYQTAAETTAQKQGVLHARKYTEYSRVVLALTAIGADPSDVGRYDLLQPLADFEKVTGQGINGAAWALLALDSGGYEIPIVPDVKIQATRQMYVEQILSKQLADGGWNLSGEGSADPDVTGMVLQALSKYTEQPAVKTAVEQALTCLSHLQDETGGFSSYAVETSESVAQVIVALGELGINFQDERFVKNGNTLLDALLGYWNADGSFRHTPSGESNLMATEQGFYGLVAAQRAMNGESGLYQMADSKQEAETPVKEEQHEKEALEHLSVDLPARWAAAFGRMRQK
ncbi:MAG: prenyltransferase/squalene oxidase repeat-containing protein [Anaerotignum sp.]